MAASYATQQMGLKLFVYNRTYEKGEEIARQFGGSALKGLEGGWSL